MQGGRHGWKRATSDARQEPWFGARVQRRARGRGRRGSGRRREGRNEHVAEPAQHPGLVWYRRLFGDQVDRELEEEQKQVEERLRTWPLDRLKREGYALTGCRARTHGRLFNQTIVRFSSPNQMLPQHVFSQGDLVTITRTSPLDRVDAEGVVYERRVTFLSAVFDKLPKDLTQSEWRLDKGTNKVAYDRMQHALKQICCPDHALPPWLRPTVIPSALIHTTSDEQSELPDPLSIVNAALLRSGLLNSELDLEALSKMTQPGGVKLGLQTLQSHADGILLNESQRKAVENGLHSQLSLIQGPPGTGKTSTAGHLIKAFRTVYASSGPILATAQSNVAVDQLLSACLRLGLHAVRLGQPVKVTPELQGRTLDAHIEQHPRMPEVETIRAELQELHAFKPNAAGREIGLLHRDLNIKYKQLNTTMGEISSEVVNSADVICSTCIGAGSDLLKEVSFRFIVLDEATQCTEPEALVPLMKATEDASVVIIGDHQQLPPTVLSQNSQAQRILGLSLFQRLAAVLELLSHRSGQQVTGMSSALSTIPVDDASVSTWISLAEPLFRNVRTAMLREQYRMHPVLSSWPSQKFYNGLLVNGVDVKDRQPPSGIEWPRLSGADMKSPLVFVPLTSGFEETSSNGQSKFNVIEAEIVVSLVNRLLRMGDVRPSDIGVITPYAAQMQRIKGMLSREGRRVITQAMEAVDDSGHDSIEVKTVDGYQGREKDVIILSAVRSNPNGQVGFLDDYRRFNVAVTRAKRGLIIVGNPNTLQHDPFWKSWLDFIKSHKLAISQNSMLRN